MNNLIIRLDYPNLRNETHVELNENAKRILAKHNPETLGISPQYVVYNSALEDEIAVLDLIRKSDYTAEIQEQDHYRDRIFRGFVDTVQSSLHHFDPDKCEAASTIEVMLEHYGNLSVKTYDEETAAIDDLLRELASGDYPSLVNALQINDWLTKLNVENQKFKDLMSDRYLETSQRPPVNMKAARKNTDKALYDIIYLIEALVMVNGIDAYRDFIRELNAVLERYRLIQAQKKGRKKAKNN
ncbi:MAG: DUF6261 family protein [Dysgonamonadaceae bacterium]|jgi:hypothetical protein|nr:DUF6261 family protein [Dysgonamonadaceae bacterium]